jgi:hypothetical protein
VSLEAIRFSPQTHLERASVEGLVAAEAFECLGKPYAQIGFLEHVQQSRHRPAPQDFCLDVLQVRGGRLRRKRGEHNPVIAVGAQPDLRVSRQSPVKLGQGLLAPSTQISLHRRCSRNACRVQIS